MLRPTNDSGTIIAWLVVSKLRKPTIASTAIMTIAPR
jgi:hypothetical protein